MSRGAAAVAAALLAASTAAASPHLRVAPRLPLGDFDWGQVAVVGDFDGDGHDDAAYGRGYTSGVAVMLGDGSGGFGTPVVTQASHPVVSTPVGLHAADFNGDGRLDLAQSDFASGFFVYLGLGDGRFAQAAVADVTAFVAASAIGDFDGDGRQDLALAAYPQGPPGTRVLVYRGLGNGTFAAESATTVATVVWAGGMAAADVNGDGRDDLVVTDRTGTSGMTVLLGAPNLAFAQRGPFGTGGRAGEIALGDLNGDGRTDAVTGGPEATGGTAVLLGDGTGAFALLATLDSAPGRTSVGLADVDGDGRLDLAASSAHLWIRRGDGAGHFGAPERFGLTGRIAPGELTGDGRTDLLVGDDLFAMGGAGDFVAQRAYPAGTGPRYAVADDFDRDGRTDVVVANASGAVTLIRGDGAGGFGPPTGALVGSLPTDLVRGDFDRDGWPDVAVGYEGTRDVVVLRNDHAGGFTARAFPQAGVPRLLVVEDFGGDGIADIAVVNETTATIDVMHGLPDGTFAPGGSTPFAGVPLAVVAGRFNGDDRADLVVCRMRDPNSPRTAMLVGTGLETFVPGPEPELPLYATVHGLVARDFDGDGRLDLAGAGDVQPGSGLGGLGVLLGRGDGRFDRVRVQPPTTVFALAAADFTLDGRPDLVTLPFEGGLLRSGADLFVGAPGGRFTWAGEPSVSVGQQATRVVTGDFDGDGRPDAVAVTEAADAVTVLRGRAPASAAANLGVTVSAAPDPVALGEPFHYHVAVANQGPAAAQGVRLVFTMPGALSVIASTPGSPVCTAASNAYTCALPTLAAGASFTFDADVRFPLPRPEDVLGTPPPLDGQAFAWAQVGAVTPADPFPADNLATSYVSVGPVDLVLAVADSADPVAPGQPYRYTFTVTNAGAFPASRVFLDTELPPGVALIGVGPGCAELPNHITCAVPLIPAGESAAFDIDVTAGSYTSSVLAASVSSDQLELVPADNADREETSTSLGLASELAHGTSERGSLPPGAPAQRSFLVLVPPRASFEVVLDEVSGDYGTAATRIALDRLAADGSTVLQAGVATGTGPGRTLRWQNTTEEPQRHLVRVRSRGCTTDCGPDDGYRVRAYETTASLARYNTAGGQATVVVVQNPTGAAVTGTLWFAEGDGSAAAARSFFLPAHGSLTLNVASLLPGRAGSLTVTHDAGYGGLAAKAIAVEPANGTSYDTVLRFRPR